MINELNQKMNTLLDRTSLYLLNINGVYNDK